VGSLTAKLRGSYGRSTRPPQPQLKIGQTAAERFGSGWAYYSLYYENFDIQFANPELGPEYQQGGEGGLELYLGTRGSLVITRYNQTVDGLINNVSPIDSVRALQPGLTGISGCGNENNLRSDGYCYLVQGQNLNVGS